MLSAFGKVFRRTASRLEVPAAQKPLMRVLEPRILLDAAGVETAEKMTEQAAHSEMADAQDFADKLPTEGQARDPEQNLNNDVVFIDGNVEDIGSLLSELHPDVEVHILDLQTDGVEQIAGLLEGRSDLAAVHIFSHGGEGFLNLGSSQVSAETITTSHVEALNRIGAALGEDGDILIYGCNFGAGETGRAAAQALSTATGADIAASDDLTGAADKGGDWDLEVIQGGKVEAESFKFEGFNGILDAFTLGTVNAPTVNLVSPSVIGGDNVGGAGTTAVWANAGVVELDGGGTVSVDVRATVVSVSDPQIGVNFGTRAIDAGATGPAADLLDDFRVQIRNGLSATADPGDDPQVLDAGNAVIVWEIFESGTGQTVRPNIGEVGLTISDIDGRGGLTATREALGAALTDLSSYTVQAGTNLVVSNDGTTLFADGTQDQADEEPSWIQYNWSSVNQLTMTYRTHTPNAFFNHDGDGDLVFSAPVTSAATGIDLDANDSSTATNSDYLTEFVQPLSGIGAPVAIADGDIEISNTNGMTTGATVMLTNQSAGDVLTFDNTFLATLGITATASTGPGGEPVITLTGDTSTGNYQSAIQSITYGNTQASFDSSFNRLIEVQAFDGGFASGIATTTVTFSTSVNDPVPTRDLYTVDEDGFLSVPAGAGSILSNDTDPQNDALTITGATDVDGNAIPLNTAFTLPSGGTVLIRADGSFDYTPVADFSGVDTFDYVVSDPGGNNATSYVAINVQGVADAPTVPVGIASAVANEDQDTNAVDLTSSQADADGSETLSYSVTRIPAGYTITDGTFQFTSTGLGDVVLLDDWDITNISLLQPAVDDHSDNDILVNLVVESSEPNGSTASTTEVVRFNVAAVADAPTLNLSATAGGAVDVPTALGSLIGADLVDVDGSETITGYTLSNWPAGFQLLQGGTPLTPAAGPFTFTPAELATISVQTTSGFLGTFTIDVVATSSETNAEDDVAVLSADSPLGQLSITIDNVDDPVTAVDDTAATFSGIPVTISSLINDAVPDGGAIITFVDGQAISPGATISLVSGNGQVTLNLDGALTFLSDPTFVGDETFSYVVADQDGDTDAADVVVSVGPSWTITGDVSVNEGADATYQIDLNGPVGPGESASVDLLLSDIDTSSADYDSLVAAVNDAIVGRPELSFDGTTLTFDNTPTATYNPTGGGFVDISGSGTALGTTDESSSAENIGFDFDFFGTTYNQLHVNDNGFVTFNSGIINTFNNVDMSGGTALGGRPAIAALWNDYDPGAAGEVYIETVGTPGNRSFIIQWEDVPLWNTGTAQFGSFQIILSEATGEIVFNYQDLDFAGTSGDFGAGSTIGIQDGVGTGVQFAFNSAGSVANGSSVTFSGAASLAPLTIDLGTVSDGDFEADEDFNISLSSAVNSGIAVAQDDVTTTIVDSNQPPVNNNPDTSGGATPATTTPEDTPLVFSTANGNGISVDDADGDNLSVTLTVTNGILNAATGSGATLSNDGTASVTISGTQAQVNSALQGLQFTNTPDYNGSAVLMIQTNDNEGQPNSIVTSSVQIAVTPVSDVVDDAVTTNEDVAVSFNVLTGTNGATADTFEGSPILTSVTQGSNGVVTFLPAGLVTYTPNSNFNGNDSFTYTVTSGGVTETATVTMTVLPVNDAPVAVDDSDSTAEDTTLTVPAATGLLTNDTDLDGDTLVVSDFTVGATTVAAGATINLAEGDLTINTDGSYTFVPAADYNGPVPVATYTVSDGNGGTDTATLTIAVTPVNDAPVAVDDTDSTAEDVTLTVPAATGLLTNDTDLDGDTLVVSDFTVGATTVAAGATISLTEGDLTINADGSYTFVPAADYNGPVPVATYTVSDGNGGTDTATLTIAVTPVNDAPVAVDDTDSTAEDTTLTVPAATGLLTNDTDLDGDTLVVSDFTVGATTVAAGSTINLAEGDLTINADGSYTFVPAADYNGPVPVATYTVSDGNGGTDTATLTIAVTPVNDAPVAVDDTDSTAEDVTLTVPAATGLLTNDTDLDGDTLVVSDFTVGATTVAAGSTINLTEGDLTINADGSYTFVPAADYNGPVPVATYTVSDGNGGTDTATLTIAVTPVNDAPVAVDDTDSTAEDTTLTVPAATGLLTNDTDLDGDTLVVSDFTVGATTVAAGSTISLAEGDLTINADGSYTFVPAADYNGPVPVATYTVSDGNGGTDTATLTIAVTPVNDAPVAVDDTDSTAEDVTLTVPAVAGLLTNDTDLDGDTLVVSDFTVGATTVAAGATINLTEGDLTINADGSYTFVPAADYNGPVPVATYTVSDGNGGTDTATLTIAVTPVNDAPLAVDDTDSTAEDTTLTVPAATGLLTNDTDLDGDALMISGFTVGGSPFAPGATANLAEGDLTINADGSYTFVPAADYNGPVPVATYTVSDGNGGTDTATLTIAVTPVNDAPVAVDDTDSTAEDTILTVPAVAGLLTNDTDLDGDTLAVSDFTVGATTVAAGSTINLTEGDLTINADGSYTFVPAADYNGPVPVATYTVSDGNGGTDSATLTIAVTPVNDAPVAVDDTDSTAEDTILTVPAVAGLLTNDTDLDGDTLVVSDFTVGATTVAAGSTINLAEGDLTINADGSYTFVPAADYNGPVPVATYTVSDGNGGTDTATLTIAVTPVNDAPLAVDDTDSTAEDTTLTVPAATGLLTNDTDLDGDALMISGFTVGGSPFAPGATANLTEGDLTINADGSYTFVPAADYNGPVPVATYTVSDGNGGTDTATLTIAVTPVNDAPVAVDDTDSTAEDTILTVPAVAGLLTNDTDLDGDTLAVSDFTVGATTVAAGSTINLTEGDLTINADGSYTFVPAADYNGPVPVATYTVSDGNGGTDSATLTIAVTPVNDAPVAVDDTDSTAEDTILTVPAVAGLLTNDTDLDGDTLVVSDFTVGATTVAAGATISLTEGDLTINADGSYTFVPAADYNGPVPVATYTVSDGNGGTDTATLTIAVTPVNDAPVAVDDTDSTAEDTTLAVPAATGLLTNDTDLDGDTLVVSDFTVGATTVAAGATINLAEGDLTINADGSYTFVPATDYNGPVPVATYTVSDGNGGTDTATLTIAVTPVNDAPVAVDDTDSTAEDTTLTVSGGHRSADQ